MTNAEPTAPEITTDDYMGPHPGNQTRKGGPDETAMSIRRLCLTFTKRSLRPQSHGIRLNEGFIVGEYAGGTRSTCKVQG